MERIKPIDLGELIDKKRLARYSFKNYKPNKNCVPVEYKGKKYLSKAQCVALEKITRKELEDYLANPDA